MDNVVAININVFQFGTHVGLTLDLVFPTLGDAVTAREVLKIHAEAAKLLSDLGFDTSALDDLFEVDPYGI